MILSPGRQIILSLMLCHSKQIGLLAFTVLKPLVGSCARLIKMRAGSVQKACESSLSCFHPSMPLVTAQETSEILGILGTADQTFEQVKKAFCEKWPAGSSETLRILFGLLLFLQASGHIVHELASILSCISTAHSKKSMLDHLMSPIRSEIVQKSTGMRLLYFISPDSWSTQMVKRALLAGRPQSIVI